MGSDAWYYSKDGQQVGPITSVVLQQMVASGHLSPADYVWRDGMPDWLPVESVPELFGDYPSAQPYAPPPGYAHQPLGYQQPYQPPAYSDATSHYQTKFKGAQQEGRAQTAMTMSIIGLFICGPILGPISLAMGISALNSMKRTRSNKGQSQAITAVVIGGLETLLTVGAVVYLAFIA